jgi:hypothetical protein
MFSFVLNRVIERNHSQKRQVQITNYLQRQREYIKIIQNCIKNNESNGFAEALKKFKVTSVLLREIDSNEKAQLEKLDYWDNVRYEIKYILDNIESKKMTDSFMQQACSTINNFLKNYLEDRNNIN